jgi:hypothetical protein
MEGIIFLQFLRLGLITHRLYKMEPIFQFDVSRHEYKLSMGGMNEDERLERSNALPNSQKWWFIGVDFDFEKIAWTKK